MPDTSFDAQAAFNLTGETAVVTGAGAGIGRGVALACAAAGAKVVAADLNAEGAEKTAALITQKGGDAVAGNFCAIFARGVFHFLSKRYFLEVKTRRPIGSMRRGPFRGRAT